MKYAKAVVPLAVGAVLWVLSSIGVTGEMNVKETLTLIVTAGLVWFIPNKK